jgi:hypothetical protein
MFRYKLAAAVLGFALGLVTLSAYASSVTNTPIYGVGVIIGDWGPSALGGGQSYGLVFTAPQSELNDFSVAVSSDASVETVIPPLLFVAQVYAWNGSETTGFALYTSAANILVANLKTYTFTADIAVTEGASYIAFVTSQPGGVSLGGSWSGWMQAGYGPATLWFAEGNPSAPGAWVNGAPFGNAWFNANFSSGVPEPSTWAMMLAGFAGLRFLRYRRNKAAGSDAA